MRFGLAIPSDTWRGIVLAVFLVPGPLISGVPSHAAPPSWHEQLDGGRGFGFLIGSALAAAWLRASGDARPET